MAASGEEGGNLAHAANILSPVRVAVAQVRIQACAQVVTVKDIDTVAFGEQPAFQLDCQRRLARTRQSRKPENTTAVAGARPALGAGDAALDGKGSGGGLSHGVWTLSVRN